MRTASSLLENLSCFEGLERQEINAVAACSRIERKPAAFRIFTGSDSHESMFLVLEGLVYAYSHARDGREVILYWAQPGMWFGEAPLGHEGTYGCEAVCARETALAVFPMALLRPLYRQQPRLLSFHVTVLERRLRSLANHVPELCVRGIEGRLASFIYVSALHLTGQVKNGTVLTRSLSMNTVAAQLGTVREEVSRALAALSRRGLIEVTRKDIRILDAEGLMHAATDFAA